MTSSVLGVAALVFAFIAGLQPAFSTLAPQRLNVDFIDDHVDGKALWAIDTGAPLPAPFRAVMPFSATPEKASPIMFQQAFVASAGATRYAAPDAAIFTAPQGQGRKVTLTFDGSERTNEILLVVPNGAGLSRVEIEGKSFVPAPDTSNPAGTIIGCLTRDCRNKSVTLQFDSKRPVEVWLGEIDYGLPADGARLESVRPNTTIASQSGDSTIVFGKLTL